MAIRLKVAHAHIEALRKAGVPIIRGKDLVPPGYILRRRVSLKAVHRALASFKGSLADEISRMREEA